MQMLLSSTNAAVVRCGSCDKRKRGAKVEELERARRPLETDEKVKS
jgi:hypothetical protein